MILARGTPGFSGAELQNMVKWVAPLFTRKVPLTRSFSLAAIQAAKEGFKEVTLKHFEWAKVSFFRSVSIDRPECPPGSHCHGR